MLTSRAFTVIVNNGKNKNIVVTIFYFLTSTMSKDAKLDREVVTRDLLGLSFLKLHTNEKFKLRFFASCALLLLGVWSKLYNAVVAAQASNCFCRYVDQYFGNQSIRC